jgi:hypothetical protein
MFSTVVPFRVMKHIFLPNIDGPIYPNPDPAIEYLTLE